MFLLFVNYLIIGIFNPPIFHPNIFIIGGVCLKNIINQWKSTTTIKQVLIWIQAMLDMPNLKSVANILAANIYQ